MNINTKMKLINLNDIEETQIPNIHTAAKIVLYKCCGCVTFKKLNNGAILNRNTDVVSFQLFSMTVCKQLGNNFYDNKCMHTTEY